MEQTNASKTIKSIDLSEPIDRKQAIAIIAKVNNSEPTFAEYAAIYLRNPISHSSSVNQFLYPNSLLTLSSKVYDKFEQDEIDTFTKYKEKMSEEISKYVGAAKILKKYQVKKPLPSIPTKTSDLDINTVNKDYYVKSDKANNIANFVKWILYNRQHIYEGNTQQKKVSVIPEPYERTKIHVVTHSDVMKGFVEHYLEPNGNTNREERDVVTSEERGVVTSEETLSTQSVINKMTENAKRLDQVQFKISRHAYSCNNALDEGKLGVLDKNFDPGLTYAGIFLAKSHGQLVVSNSKPIYESNTVYVSCLLRTWETATMLYLQNIKDGETLTLIISPFLKETHGTVSKALAARGNYPAFFFQQLQLFHYFLFYCLAIGIFNDIINRDKTIQLFLNANYYVTIIISKTMPLSWILYSNGIEYELNMPDVMPQKLYSNELEYALNVSNVMPQGSRGGGWFKSHKRVNTEDDETEDRSKLPEEITETNLWSIDFTVEISPIQKVVVRPKVESSVPKQLAEQQQIDQEPLDKFEGGSIFSRKYRKIHPEEQNDKNTHNLNIIGDVVITSGTGKPGKIVLDTYACNPLCLKTYYSKRKWSTRFAPNRDKTCKKQMINKGLIEDPNSSQIGLRQSFLWRTRRGGRKTKRRKMRNIKK